MKIAKQESEHTPAPIRIKLQNKDLPSPFDEQRPSKQSQPLKKGDGDKFRNINVQKKPTSKLHSTVAHVPSPRFSKNDQLPKEPSSSSRLTEAKDKQFLDT